MTDVERGAVNKGAHALARRAIEAFARAQFWIVSGEFVLAEIDLGIAEDDADQALALRGMWEREWEQLEGRTRKAVA